MPGDDTTSKARGHTDCETRKWQQGYPPLRPVVDGQLMVSLVAKFNIQLRLRQRYNDYQQNPEVARAKAARKSSANQYPAIIRILWIACLREMADHILSAQDTLRNMVMELATVPVDTKDWESTHYPYLMVLGLLEPDEEDRIKRLFMSPLTTINCHRLADDDRMADISSLEFIPPWIHDPETITEKYNHTLPV
ncbi:hypothetical protein MKZ38_006248 [Zalerion maritima]|uniref:Uncharacterized protein n=1 Tax=Zalerion maritima TaxID=339359 RepID=A0AAD5RJ42_9PEZI|nr:hypothetical protein MKZ38_006248 [Zalerion maritima]